MCIQNIREKEVYIVGLGPGHKDYILPKAIETLNNSDIVLGFKRALESIDFVESEKIIISTVKEVGVIMENNKNKSISIVASGDPCFYGITNYIKNYIYKDVKVIPGISSFQYLMSKLAMPWQGAYLGSMHGREDDFLDVVKKNKLSLWLTDNKNTPQELCGIMENNHIEAKVYIGENLSYEDEVIFIGTPHEGLLQNFSALTVLVVEIVQ